MTEDQVQDLLDGVTAIGHALDEGLSAQACDYAGGTADAINYLSESAKGIANAITPTAAPGHDETGGTVMSLTESVMGMTAGLCRIAEAISDLAQAVRESHT